MIKGVWELESVTGGWLGSPAIGPEKKRNPPQHDVKFLKGPLICP